VDAPFDVAVQAVDAWGNATAMPSGDLAITGTVEACSHASARLVDGAGSVELVCGAASLDTELTVSGAGLSGSAVVDILDLACPTGPTANLLLDGAEDAITCGDTVVASVAESVPGDAAIDRVWLQVGEGSWAVTAEDGGIANLGATGIHVVRAVVADDRGCGDLDEAVAWAGRDDGSATGPITVAGPAIASDGDTVTMAVVATTCSGAVAAGDMLGVRADVGAPVVGATGDGLALTLDTGGASTFAWRVDDGHGGPATLQVGTATAWGTASVVVAGDTVAPRIVAYSYEAGETVTLQFSEPMDIASVALALDGAPVPVAWDADGVRATVDVDGVAGAPFTVHVSPTAADLAGNTLADADRVRFDAGDAGLDTPGACAADLARFTPDGDDGAGTAADQVTVTWTAAADPAAWVWRVLQDGEVARAGRESGSARALLWDGRGDDGRIVEAGAYAIEVRAVAPDAAEGSACAAYVGVRETFTAPSTTR
jgi:hypothetical protein